LSSSSSLFQNWKKKIVVRRKDITDTNTTTGCFQNEKRDPPTPI